VASEAPAIDSSRAAPEASDPALEAPFRDDFERSELGPSWRPLSAAWRLDKGELCAEGARNRGVWLARRIPLNARIEFDARSESREGDIKVEAWGDGESGATGTSYSNATSYLAIFGGWDNQLHVLARLDEHGPDRHAMPTRPDSDEPVERPVAVGQRYRFRIERSDGKTIGWWVDDALVHEIEDAQPLAGAGHDHFGFNDWQTKVCFDNLVVTPLGP
jgi:hypothetical protein